MSFREGEGGGKCREKAVRLVANRLLGEHGLQERIEQYAQEQLMRITLPRQASGVLPGDAGLPAEPAPKEEDVPSTSRSAPAVAVRNLFGPPQRRTCHRNTRR